MHVSTSEKHGMFSILLTAKPSVALQIIGENQMMKLSVILFIFVNNLFSEFWKKGKICENISPQQLIQF